MSPRSPRARTGLRPGTRRHGLRLRGRPATGVERVEERIDAAQAQLESMREVRSSVVRKALPALGFIGAMSYAAMGWGPTEPIPGIVAGIVLSGLTVLGVGAHVGVRRSERRLDELDEELARHIGRQVEAEARGDRRIPRDAEGG